MAENTTKTEKSVEPQPLDVAIELLNDTEESLHTLLADKHEMLLIGIKAKFSLMKNQLRMLNGKSVHNHNKVDLKPITEFMGSPIKRGSEPIISKDLSPKELEIANLVKKADDLQAAFSEMDNETILESYVNDDKPIRLLAKRAGLTDFRDATLNSQYLDLIREGFNEQAKSSAAKTKDENAINNQ